MFVLIVIQRAISLVESRIYFQLNYKISFGLNWTPFAFFCLCVTFHILMMILCFVGSRRKFHFLVQTIHSLDQIRTWSLPFWVVARLELWFCALPWVNYVHLRWRHEVYSIVDIWSPTTSEDKKTLFKIVSGH